MDTKIKKIKATGKEQLILDSLGLYLRVDKYGNKTWQLRYGLGSYPAISIGTARKKRMELKELIDQGEDISYRPKAKKITTVKDLVLEYIFFKRKVRLQMIS